MNIEEAKQIINAAISQNSVILSLESMDLDKRLSQDELLILLPNLLKLENLETLNLSENKITNIPKEFTQFKNLKNLFLQHNDLKTIPKELLKLNNLSILDLRGNKDLEKLLPIEILNEKFKPERILRYYFSINEVTTRPLNEAKVVVLGEGGVGKTSLLSRLLHNICRTDTSSTHGINISNWNVEINGENIQLNFWDFGGQEILHSTHQLFFTNRTVYILVVEAIRSEGENKIEKWLKRIEIFAGNSPVLIVVNKIDVTTDYFIDHLGLTEKYKNIRGIYYISSGVINDKFNKLFDEFRIGLLKEIGKLSGLHKVLPDKW